ncbi:MAG TPA: DMT family transporter [Polyangia bacterium]|jgi:drug/metabolite transporter (DMT)-like permease
MLAGVLFGLGASACWALANVVVARSARRVGAVRALLWAQLVGIALLAELAIYRDVRPAPLSGTHVVWIAVAGVAALLAYGCLFYALQHGRLTIAVPIMSSWAVLSSAISVLGFGERLRGGQIAGAALVVLGVLLVSRHAPGETPGEDAAVQSSTGRRRPRWVLASVGTAIGFGVLIPAMEVLAPATGRLGVVCVVYAADIALGLPLALFFRVSLRPPPLDAWGVVALAGIFETAGFVCIALGALYAPLAIVSPLSSLAAAMTFLFAWLVLRERPARPAAIGAALAAIGVLILAL